MLSAHSARPRALSVRPITIAKLLYINPSFILSRFFTYLELILSNITKIQHFIQFSEGCTIEECSYLDLDQKLGIGTKCIGTIGRLASRTNENGT